MKAPSFKYLKPSTLEDCLAALSEHGDDAQILAGGQSLMPLLNLRMAGPAILIDIGGLAELKAMHRDANVMTVGALQTHAELAVSEQVAQCLPLLTQAAPFIAHEAIRSRGTIGGSVALADPAAEWPACCLALDAEIQLRSRKGTRMVPAAKFFHGPYSTERQPDELLTAIRFPVADTETSFEFVEVSRRQGDFAIAGLALSYHFRESGMTNPRVTVMGVGDRPTLATNTMSILDSSPLNTDTINTAVKALSSELDPFDDPAYPADYRLAVARALLQRTLAQIAQGVAK